MIKTEKRLYTLDYLRGLSSLGIMIYHYSSWTLGAFTSETFIGRIGVYGVAMFYVLSGLTLFHVYFEKMKPNKNDLKDFYIKRVFRIFPLLWLATIATLPFLHTLPDFKTLLLNFTGLFGIVKWDAYIGTGVWSIGNELSFYLFFPVFIFLSKQWKMMFLVLALSLLSVHVFFAFYKLNSTSSLDSQWTNYVNPLNQVFLFLGGYLVGYLFDKYHIRQHIVAVTFLASVLLFIFYPAYGNTINLVTGGNRLVFTFLCFSICFCFYKNTYHLPAILDKYLRMLGEASYSLYLLHPLVWDLSQVVSGGFHKYLFTIPNSVRIACCVMATLYLSYFVYQKFEKYFMQKGREFSKKVAVTN